MNASTTDKLALPFLQPGQALKTITHNEALQRLDAGLYLSCSDMAASEIPTAPTDGYVIILAADFSGTDAERAGQIGVFQNGSWVWFEPFIGWVIWDASEESLRVFNGDIWTAPVSNSQPELLPFIGLNSSANPAQRLAVSSPSSLFTHEGDSHRMTINRAAETDTASLIFQTEYSGGAELGLTGEDGFSLKTSKGGDNWITRLATPEDYSGLRAPAFGSVRLRVANDTAEYIETPASGGLLALTIVSDGGFPRISHSGLLAYDSGQSPSLVELAKTSRVEMHGHAIIDGTFSEDGNIGISAVEGGLYIENRLGTERIISMTFLC